MNICLSSSNKKKLNKRLHILDEHPFTFSIANQ